MTLIETWKPQVLVSDIGMPGEDGISFIRRVREMEKQTETHLPSLALSAYAGGEDQARSLEAGFEAHLPKPIAPQELVAAVAALVKGSTVEFDRTP